MKEFIEEMNALGIDAMLVSNMKNIYYLSGFFGTAGNLFVTKEQTYLITDFRYTAQAKEQTSGKNIEIINVAEGEGNIFCRLVKKHGINSVGFERAYVTYNRFLTLSEMFGGLKLLGTEGLTEEFRIVKTDFEISKIERACEIADEAFERVFARMHTGMTELEVAAMLEYEMKMQGASGTSFETIVASGVRSAMPHGTASGKPLCKGDMVVMDFGCVCDGYCSDITRTVAMEEISDRGMDIYSKVLTVQEASLENIAIGKKCSEIDRKSREMFSVWGLDKYFGHSLGHGVGLDIHELPNLSSNSAYTLEKNMIVTVEPGIYIENELGVRIEDTVTVTENGARRLTKSPKNLRICHDKK